MGPKADLSGDAYDTFSRAVDGPLTVLALLMVPILLVPLVVRLSRSLQGDLDTADYVIWALFAAEYGAKLYLAPARWRFVRTHVPDLVVVIVPFLRPLRIVRAIRLLRLLRLVRLVAFLGEGLTRARAILAHRGLNYVLLVATMLVFAAAGLELTFERTAPGSNIHSYSDGLWWAATTITTVGYGDRFPVTAAGRGVAVVVMVTGIALFGTIAASVSSYFVTQKTDAAEESMAELGDRLERIEKLLMELQQAPKAAPSAPASLAGTAADSSATAEVASFGNAPRSAGAGREAIT